MSIDITFLDGPVEVTHDHYKQSDYMVQKLKEMYGYTKNIRESSQLYKKKRLNTTNQMNQNYLSEELYKIDNDKKLKEVIEKQLNEEVDIELDRLLNNGINTELMQKKKDFISSLKEYNKIIQYQMVKDLLVVQELQEKFCIDFNQKLEEIKDYVSTIDEYNLMHVKIDDLNKKASKSLTNYRKKELTNEKKKYDAIQQEYLLKITSNIDLILNSENILSQPVKQMLIYKLNEMLFFLDELLRKKKNYHTFLQRCHQTQNICLTNIEIFSDQGESDDEGEDEEDLMFKYNINLDEIKNMQNSLNKFPFDGFNSDYISPSDKKTQLQKDFGNSQHLESVQQPISYTTDLEERIQKVQLRYQNYQLKKEKKKSLSKPPSFSKEIIELELQNLIRFNNKLNLVEKIIATTKLMKYEEIQKYLQTLWQHQDILQIQIQCAKNKLEKYLIVLNNKKFEPQDIVRLINKQIKLIKSIPDQEQVKSYIENQKRNNTFKRYCNDQNQISNFHFVLNANNLKPLLQKIDPVAFLDDEKKQQKQMQSKLKKIKEKAEQKYIQTKQNQTTTQFMSAIEMLSGRGSPTNSCKQSYDSIQNRDRSISQASAFSFLVKQTNQRQQSQKEQKEQKLFYINGANDNILQRKRNTSQICRSKKVSTQDTPVKKILRDNVNIKNYINNSFDVNGYNNNDFCEKQKDIEISSNVHYVMLSNIFSGNQDVIEIDDFIEKEKAKEEDNVRTSNDLKQLYNDKLSYFKLNQSTRPTTGKTYKQRYHKNSVSNIFEQISNNQSQIEEQDNKFQKVKSNNLSNAHKINERNNISLISRPSSSYQSHSIKQNRSTSVNNSFIQKQYSSLTQKQITSQIQKQNTSQSNNLSSIYTNNHTSIQSKNCIQNAQQYKDISPIHEQSSKDKFNDSLNSSFYKQNNTLQNSINKSFIELQQSQINLQQNKDNEQIENQELYLDDQEQKEADKLKRRKNLMQEILERKRPRFIYLGSSKNPIKGTTEQILEIEKNQIYAQQKQKNQKQQKDRIKLEQRIQSLQKKWEVSNIETLAGPPKKYFVETSTIQQDFEDKIISKIIKH